MPAVRTASNVSWGFGDIYLAAKNTVEPASAATLAEPTTGWTSVGYTSEGLMMEVSKDVEDIRVEETLTSVGQVLTSVEVSFTFEFAEDVIENRLAAYGFGTLTTTASGAGQIGKKTLVLGETLEEKAICIVASNRATGFKDRIYVPIVQTGGSVGTAYKRSEKRVYPVEFKAQCDPSLIRIVQQTSA